MTELDQIPFSELGQQEQGCRREPIRCDYNHLCIYINFLCMLFIEQSRSKTELCNILTYLRYSTYIRSIEEVSMKWMDKPSVTEMDRGGAYEMERQTKCQIKVPL